MAGFWFGGAERDLTVPPARLDVLFTLAVLAFATVLRLATGRGFAARLVAGRCIGAGRVGAFVRAVLGLATVLGFAAVFVGNRRGGVVIHRVRGERRTGGDGTGNGGGEEEFGGRFHLCLVC